MVGDLLVQFAVPPQNLRRGVFRTFSRRGDEGLLIRLIFFRSGDDYNVCACAYSDSASQIYE